MTNQEAIEYMKAYRHRLTQSISNGLDKDIEAYDMAIKALEQEPSGDLIRRQAVIDACEQSINILEAVDRIMDLPSVEQEPKTIQEKGE